MGLPIATVTDPLLARLVPLEVLHRMIIALGIWMGLLDRTLRARQDLVLDPRLWEDAMVGRLLGCAETIDTVLDLGHTAGVEVADVITKSRHPI